MSYDFPAPMSLSPGSAFGPYAVQSRLGEGGMGEVYWTQEITARR